MPAMIPSFMQFDRRTTGEWAKPFDVMFKVNRDGKCELNAWVLGTVAIAKERKRKHLTG